MKRLIALFLMVVLCFSLVACGEEMQSINNDTQEEVFEGIAEDIVFIVRFSINPEFELHLDDAGYIMDFHCLNEDAKKAFENINVVESYCEVGINELLNAAHNSGYLDDSTEIKVLSYISGKCTISEVLKNNIEETLKNYQSIVNFTYSYKILDGNGNNLQMDDSNTGNEESNADNSEAESNNETVITDNNVFDESRFIEVEKDEKGNIIKTVELDNQNRTLTRYYNISGVITCEIIEDQESTCKRILDDNGTLVKEEYSETNGNYCITEYDKDGNIKNEMEVLNNGLSITRYYANGIIEKMEQTSTDGKEIAYYDANGIIEKAESIGNDGATHTIKYVNGVIATDEWSDPNTGITGVATFNNGVIASHIKNGSNGFYEYIYYDSNGNITEILDLDNQGRDRKKIFNSDGSYITYLSINGEWVEVID